MPMTTAMLRVAASAEQSASVSERAAWAVVLQKNEYERA